MHIRRHFYQVEKDTSIIFEMKEKYNKQVALDEKKRKQEEVSFLSACVCSAAHLRFHPYTFFRFSFAH